MAMASPTRGATLTVEPGAAARIFARSPSDTSGRVSPSRTRIDSGSSSLTAVIGHTPTFCCQQSYDVVRTLSIFSPLTEQFRVQKGNISLSHCSYGISGKGARRPRETGGVGRGGVIEMSEAKFVVFDFKMLSYNFYRIHTSEIVFLIKRAIYVVRDLR